jgi:hypothetical protein
MGDRVADGRGGSERQVDDTEGGIEAVSGLLGNQLTYAGDLKGGLFDDVGQLGQVAVARALDGGGNDAGAGDANVDDRVGFTDAGRNPAPSRKYGLTF